MKFHNGVGNIFTLIITVIDIIIAFDKLNNLAGSVKKTAINESDILIKYFAQ
jgi:hypothetical protein